MLPAVGRVCMYVSIYMGIYTIWKNRANLAHFDRANLAHFFAKNRANLAHFSDRQILPLINFRTFSSSQEQINPALLSLSIVSMLHQYLWKPFR